MPLARATSAFVGVLCSVVCVVLLGGCGSAGSQPEPDGDLLEIEWVGGMCSNNLECRTVVTVAGDGTWVVTSAQAPPRSGGLPGADLAVVRATVRDADPAALTAVPFTGECERHMDGTEVVVTLGPGSAGELRLSSCEHVLDEEALGEMVLRVQEAIRTGG